MGRTIGWILGEDRSMRCSIFAGAFVGAVGALIALNAGAIGLGSKVKAKKLQGDLVNAMECTRGPTDPIDCEGQANPLPVPGEATPISSCSIKAGKFKSQVGKDLAVQIKGLSCPADTPASPRPARRPRR